MNGTVRKDLAKDAAWFVALMLVVQVLLSGFSLGANASPSHLDALGRVICTSDAGRTGTTDGPGAPDHHQSDCCTLGCSMVGAAVPHLPEADQWYPGPGHRVEIATVPARDLPVSEGRSPQNPRAPPRLT